jgi:GntR family transcriptional regulator, rspAB operon transcriptional repressor
VTDALATPDAAALPPPRLDRSRHAAPQVLDYLRERIVALDLPPGSVLSRAELAATFGLSQTPVRDALIHLAEEGLVEVFAQHKTVVSRIDIRKARQALFLRRAVELEIVRELAMSPPVRLVEALRGTIEVQKDAVRNGDYVALDAADHDFHRQLFDAADVPEIFQLIRRRSGHVDRLRRLHLPQPGKAAAVVDEHRAIADAIAGGDPDAASRQLRRHLSGTLSWIDVVRREHPQYVQNPGPP